MAGPKQVKSQYVYSSKRKPEEDRSIVLQNKQTNLKQKKIKQLVVSNYLTDPDQW